MFDVFARSPAIIRGFTTNLIVYLSLVLVCHAFSFGAPQAWILLVLLGHLTWVVFNSMPGQSALIFYPLALGFTTFAAAVGIEAGGELIETGFVGARSWSFWKLYFLYFVFVFSFGINSPDVSPFQGRSFGSSRAFDSLGRREIFIGFSIAVACVMSGAAAGVLEGFAFVQGVNRYAIRSVADGLSGALFNFYLNNRTFLAFFAGVAFFSSNLSVRRLAILIGVLAVILSVLHGEQFMATIQLGLAFLVPVMFIGYPLGVVRVHQIALATVLVLAIGFTSIYFAYDSQGLDVTQALDDRFLLQGQLWYAVEMDSGFFSPPPSGGIGAAYRVLKSVFEWDSPAAGDLDLAAVSGLRDVMMTYGRADVIFEMFRNGVTFTMGQFAVPLYWFGYAGAVVFSAVLGLALASFGTLVCQSLISGPIAMWFSAKFYANMLFGLQQGEYWYVFSVRSLLYLSVLLVLLRVSGRTQSAWNRYG